MVYITLSTGIGGGLVWGGKVFRGKDNMAGEIGHVPMSESGVLCSCGARGCLETLSSGTAIAQMAQHWARRRPDQVVRLLDLSGGKVESITAKTVFEAAREGDRTSSSIVREAAHWLARGLLTVIRILNTDRIVLGGGLIQAGALLMDPLREFLHEFRSPSIGSTTEILPAELGGHSPLYGAAAVALDLLRGSRVAS